jgi:hypothetical protein
MATAINAEGDFMKSLRRWLRGWLGIEFLEGELFYWMDRAKEAERTCEGLFRQREDFRARYEYMLKLQADSVLLQPVAPIILEAPKKP